MQKKFDLKERLDHFHAERANFKKLVETPEGVKLVASEIKKNITLAFAGADLIDYLGSMCQVGVSFVALKKELQKDPKLSRVLRNCGFGYME